MQRTVVAVLQGEVAHTHVWRIAFGHARVRVVRAHFVHPHTLGVLMLLPLRTALALHVVLQHSQGITTLAVC